MAAIRKVVRSLYHLCSHRVEVDIPDNLAEIAIRLAKDGLVPPLEQVALCSAPHKATYVGFEVMWR
jgi:hypothetical protein